MKKSNYWLPAAFMVLGVIGFVYGSFRDGEKGAWTFYAGIASILLGVLILAVAQPRKK